MSASHKDSTAAPSKPPADWLQRGLVVAMLAACAVALSPNNVDPDLWGHFKYGQDVLAEGRLPATATHTFTAAGYPWVNHENLSELALAAGYRTLGARGLLVVKCLLGLAVIGLMIRSARKAGVAMPALCALLLLVATTLTAFWSMRPQLFSYVLCALLIVVLDRAFSAWASERKADVRWLWLTPPLLAVWANSHGGFAAGFCLLAAYLGCRCVEALWHRGRRAWPLVGRLALVVIAAAVATLINPYGVDLLTWLVDALRHPRPEIVEWGAPSFSDEFFLPWVLLLAVTAAAWCFSERRRDWTHLVLIGLCVWQSASHSRHIAFVALLAGFWLPVHFESLICRFTKRGGQESESTPETSGSRKLIAAGLCLALAIVGVRLGMRLADFPVEKDEYPVDAIQYMADHRLEGKLVVAFNWAQYALAALAPEVQVAFDGRFDTCYPQEVTDMHFDFLLGNVPGKRYRSPRSGPIDGRSALEFFSPDLVLVDREYRHSTKTIEQHEAFVLLYQDRVAQVWGRRDRYDDPASPHYLAESQREISDRQPTGSVTWPALPVRAVGRLAQETQPKDQS